MLKIVSQHVVNLRLLVRAALTCTRTSASVRTLSRRAATVAVHQSHAVLQLAAVTAAVMAAVTAAVTAAMQTQAAVLQLPAVTAAEMVAATAAMQMQAAVPQHVAMVAATAAIQTQAAVLQLPAAMAAEMLAATAAMQTQAAVLQPPAVTDVETHVAMVAEATLAAARAVTAATMIAATSQS